MAQQPTTNPFLVEGGPNLLLRVAWFILIGWWLGGILTAVAWFFNATIVGLPLGLWLINRLPTFITLRPQERRWLVVAGTLSPAVGQRPFLIRALWFLLIGWWLSGVWLTIAYVLLVSVVGIPIAFWMYGRIGAVTTLFRS